MQIPILIEMIEDGRFRARTGEPFALTAEGTTPDDAARLLGSLLRERLHAGTRLAVIDLGNGPTPLSQAPLHLEPLPDEDWFFRALREAITEHRQRENEAGG